MVKGKYIWKGRGSPFLMLKAIPLLSCQLGVFYIGSGLNKFEDGKMNKYEALSILSVLQTAKSDKLE